MKQLGLGLNLSIKRAPKREFLEELERVVRWAALVQVVAPYYAAVGLQPSHSVQELVAEHWQAAHRAGLTDLVLDDVPVLGELSVLDPDDVSDDPVAR